MPLIKNAHPCDIEAHTVDAGATNIKLGFLAGSSHKGMSTTQVLFRIESDGQPDIIGCAMPMFVQPPHIPFESVDSFMGDAS